MNPQVGILVQFYVTPEESHKNNGGAIAAAVITGVFDNPDVANLKILFDSPMSEWKTSVKRGTEPGQWSPIAWRLDVHEEPKSPPAADAGEAGQEESLLGPGSANNAPRELTEARPQVG